MPQGKSNRDTSSSDMDLIPMKDVRGKWFDRNTHQRNDPKRYLNNPYLFTLKLPTNKQVKSRESFNAHDP